MDSMLLLNIMQDIDHFTTIQFKTEYVKSGFDPGIVIFIVIVVLVLLYQSSAWFRLSNEEYRIKIEKDFKLTNKGNSETEFRRIRNQHKFHFYFILLTFIGFLIFTLIL